MFWREIKLFSCSVFHISLPVMKIETANINKLIDTFASLIVMIQPIHKQSNDESYLQKHEIFFSISWSYFTVLGFVFNLSLWMFGVSIARLSSTIRSRILFLYLFQRLMLKRRLIVKVDGSTTSSVFFQLWSKAP